MAIGFRSWPAGALPPIQPKQIIILHEIIPFTLHDAPLYLHDAPLLPTDTSTVNDTPSMDTTMNDTTYFDIFSDDDHSQNDADISAAESDNTTTKHYISATKSNISASAQKSNVSATESNISATKSKTALESDNATTESNTSATKSDIPAANSNILAIESDNTAPPSTIDNLRRFLQRTKSIAASNNVAYLRETVALQVDLELAIRHNPRIPLTQLASWHEQLDSITRILLEQSGLPH